VLMNGSGGLGSSTYMRSRCARKPASLERLRQASYWKPLRELELEFDADMSTGKQSWEASNGPVQGGEHGLDALRLRMSGCKKKKARAIEVLGNK